MIRNAILSILGLGLVAGCSDHQPPDSAQVAYRNAIASYERYDDAEAARWFEVAAAQGDAKSETLLAMMHVSGEGVPQNLAEGRRRLHLAADHGSSGAQVLMGVMLISEVSSKATTEPEKEGQLVDALQWLKRASDDGNTTAKTILGNMYFTLRASKDGNEGPSQKFVAAGVPKDEAEALGLMQTAAEKGNAGGLVEVGDHYRFGNGVREDAAEAVRWYKLAAEEGDATGQQKLGDMHWYGTGVPKNPVEAVRWYRLSADQGHREGQASLAKMYEIGQGVPENESDAVRWYTLAAEQGYQQAQYSLAAILSRVGGTKRNLVQAYKWYNVIHAGFPNEFTANAKAELRRNMTPEQLAEAQQLSSGWKPKRNTQMLTAFFQ